jgi:hypothetical protein
MSRHIIFVLAYHRHKLLDVIYNYHSLINAYKYSSFKIRIIHNHLLTNAYIFISYLFSSCKIDVSERDFVT